MTPEETQETTNDAPLSLSDAVKAYTAPEPEEEADPGQSEASDAQEGDTAEDDDTLEAEAPESEDDDEGDPAEDDQAEEGEDDQESDQGRFVADNAKVRVKNADGTESIVSIADLKKGSLLHGDYTRKTQEVAELRRSVESQSSAIKQREQELSQQAEYATKLIQAILPPPPDPEMANPQSPKFDLVGYMSQDAARKQWEEHLTYLSQQQHQTAEQAKSEAEAKAKERREAEWALALQKLPELKDPKRLEAFGLEVNKYGQTYGYTPQELSAVANDHRSLVVLKKAIAWDKLQAKKAAPPNSPDPKRPPVMKGGKRLDAGASKARQATAAMERLNKSGALKDGIAAYLATQK